MYIYELVNKLNELIPESTQDNWDNSGRQVGDFNQKIKGIVLALDVLDEVIDYAIDNNINLIITHHPFFFETIKSLELDNKKMENLYKLINNDICVYSLHTNFDKYSNGVSMALANILKVEKISSMEDDYGIFGEIEKTTALKLGENLKEKLDLNNIIVYGDLNKEIKKVSLMGGSGSSFINKAKELNSDLYISGDIKYHDAMFAMENGLTVFDIGHFSSEFPSLEILKEYIERFVNTKMDIYKMSERYQRKIL